MDFTLCHRTHTLPTPQSMNSCNEYELFHFFLFILCHPTKMLRASEVGADAQRRIIPRDPLCIERAETGRVMRD